jgi:hypothetical protein
MRSTEPIEVPPYLCTMSAIVVLELERKPRHARGSGALVHGCARCCAVPDRLEGMKKLATIALSRRTPGTCARKLDCGRKSRLLNGDAAQNRLRENELGYAIGAEITR